MEFNAIRRLSDPFRRDWVGSGALIGYLLAMYVFLYLPLMYIFPLGLQGNVAALWRDVYVQSIWFTIQVAAVVASVTTVLTVIAAHYYRHVRHKNTYLVLMTLPLFLPSSTHALSITVTAKVLEIDLSFWTLVASHVFYAFPYAFLILLAIMAGRPANVTEAAMDLGASGFRAFWDVELPLIQDGVLSAFLVAFLLSFNEAVRSTYLVPKDTTISGLIYNYFLSTGLDQTVYTLNIIIMGVAVLIISFIMFVLILRD